MQLCIFVVSYILCFHVIAVVTTKLQLKQKLSPLQIQTIKLLELPALELDQRVRKELEENPVLETKDNEDDRR